MKLKVHSVSHRISPCVQETEPPWQSPRKNQLRASLWAPDCAGMASGRVQSVWFLSLLDSEFSKQDLVIQSSQQQVGADSGLKPPALFSRHRGSLPGNCVRHTNLPTDSLSDCSLVICTVCIVIEIKTVFLKSCERYVFIVGNYTIKEGKGERGGQSTITAQLRQHCWHAGAHLSDWLPPRGGQK